MKMVTNGSLIIAALILRAASGIAQVSGEWKTTGSLATGRYEVTAVIQSGKALVAGGIDSSNNVLSSTEVYNPTTGAWSAGGNLNVARNTYMAVTLLNGKVLVAGGCTTPSCSAATPTAELYDPSTGKWSLTGHMAGIHYFSTATLLANGTVLVEGGCSRGNCNAITASAELYNPATGKWSLTGSMKTARDYHTATLLANGKVLVAGGFGGGDTAEIYDPATGKWSSAANMIYAQELHAAVRLANGKVLLLGSNSPSAFCQIYDPTANTWQATGSMATSRSGPAALLLANGKVLVAGGASFTRPHWFKVATAELYDPALGTWSPTGSMSIGRYEHAMTLLGNGWVLAAGGISDMLLALASAELYTP